MEARKLGFAFTACIIAIMAFSNVAVKAAGLDDTAAPAPAPTSSAVALGVPAAVAAIASVAAAAFY
ncbi:uncharacterized protein LOC127248106 [Andrographis paniculata]|uniref:uncharacterized protein LOC127248106 n=1 Tax=Andrographis paniculata TaxID=175694 RepID=UPI0021E94046|nr:uncharacterized protein LOC127248106 [Andrographis paniculata]